MKRWAMIPLFIGILFLWNIPKPSAQFLEAGVQELEVPVEAPDFTLNVLGGGRVSLNEFRGKIVLLNFFTSWCPICRGEFLSFDRLYEEFKGEDIVFLKVAVKAKENELIKYRKFSPILMDDDGLVAKAYGVGHHETFFINREGKIVGKTYSEEDWTSPSMRNLIEHFLGEDK